MNIFNKYIINLSTSKMWWNYNPFLLLVLYCWLGLLGNSCGGNGVDGYFADWGMLGSRPQEPTCVDIPRNMSLCSSIGYKKMRLPNLLDHGSVQETMQQSGSWVPLLNVGCHPDTQLFLCSLFTPVCLETAIYPCRSLCMTVQKSCEGRMRTYGYHWPDMLRCDNFPDDNDMCIKQQHETPIPEDGDDGINIRSDCEVCEPINTLENILDNYCRSDFVIRARIRKQKGKELLSRKARVYKKGKVTSRLLRRPRFLLSGEAECCSIKPTTKPYLIMGMSDGTQLVPTFVLPWKKSKDLKDAVKSFRQINCSDPNLYSSTVMDGAIQLKPTKTIEPTKKKKKGRRKGNSHKNKASIIAYRTNNKDLHDVNDILNHRATGQIKKHPRSRDPNKKRKKSKKQKQKQNSNKSDFSVPGSRENF